VRNVKIASLGPNNDGCDPESCTDVLIQGCEFVTGDDCIAIKSGRNRDGRRVAVPSQNIIIRDCVMKDGHGGVAIGSEISGDARNIFAESCRMDSPNLERVLRLKTNSVRGGVIEHVYMRNTQAGLVKGAAVDIDFNYEEGDAGPYKPVVRDIEVRDLTCRKSQYAWTLVSDGVRKPLLVHARREEPAIHGNALAGDKAGPIRSEQYRSSRQFAGLAEPSHRRP
jgi:polygalacturonase